MIDICGRDDMLDLLRNSARKGALPGVLLFLGQPGSGKFSTALWLASLVNCQADVGKPCGECILCRKIERLNSPDLLIVRPDPDTWNIKLEQARGLASETCFAPIESGRKVCVIKDADRMTEEASNALLKILEEPPSYMLFILTATDSSLMLPTVVSRCFRFRFSDLSDKIIAERLITNRRLPPSEAGILSSISCGSLGTALAFADNPEKMNRRIKLMELLTELHVISSFSLSVKLDGLCGSPSDFIFIKNIILTWLRDLILSKTGADFGRFINYDFDSRLREQSANVSFESLREIASFMFEIGKASEYNVNPVFCADWLFQKIWLVFSSGLDSGRKGEIFG